MLADSKPSQTAAGISVDRHLYLFTSEYRRMTRDKVTPDYAAVLLVCSRYLWISPMQLHTEVAQLECEMLEVEAAVSSATS